MSDSGARREDLHYIGISEDVFIGASKAGQIAGPTAEGTLGIVFYGVHESDLGSKEPRAEKAIKIPRLLQSDQLLNFHVGEIGFHEGNQAKIFANSPGLLGANSFFRLSYANPKALIPGAEYRPCYIGFFLSPTQPYGICLLSEVDAWPERFKRHLGGIEEIRRLFNEVSKLCAETAAGFGARNQLFNNLLFLPHRSPNTRRAKTELLTILGRDELASTHVNREMDGWWFNLPVAIYPWMSINLERVLNGVIDDLDGTEVLRQADAEQSSEEDLDETHFTDDSTLSLTPVSVVVNRLEEEDREVDHSLEAVKDWSLYYWFRLATQLAEGIRSLHQRGAIHGDTRPANIMTGAYTAAEMTPSSFKWIDIGLGYGALGEGASYREREQTVITPPPLGGGRTTPFYAPERIEVTEYEDADTVTFKASARDDELSTLTFGWRRRTNEPPEAIALRRGGVALRELGRLKKGDRIQVREFLFEVEEVHSRSIEISNVYEIVLDRVLIQIPNGDLARAYRHLKEASISRYRIFKHWSQATDVHGLGVVVLYIFFMRGIFVGKRDAGRRARPTEEDTDSNPELLYNRPDREAAFEDMISLLRNEGILVNILERLTLPTDDEKNQRYRNIGGLFQEDLMSNAKKRKELLKVVQVLTDVDSNFKYVWLGLDRDHGRFVQLIVGICLCCLWRADEIRDVMERYRREYDRKIDFAFEPFAESRIRITDRRKAATPADKAWSRLDALAQSIRSSDEGAAGKHGAETVEALPKGPTSRDIIRQLQEMKSEKEKLEKELADSKGVEESLESMLSQIQRAILDTSSRIREMSDIAASRLTLMQHHAETKAKLATATRRLDECALLCRDALHRVKMSSEE